MVGFDNEMSMHFYETKSELMLLRSPYVWTPHIHITNPLSAVLTALTQPLDEDTNPYWKTYIGRVYLEFIRCCTEGFIQSELNNRFSYWNPSKDVKKYLEPEVKLWCRLYRMLERLHTLSPFAQHPAIAFLDLILERELCVLNFPSRNMTATKAIPEIRHQNRCLQKLENPFPIGNTSKATHETVALAILEAGKNDLFRKEYYMPLVRARMSAVKSLDESHPNTIKQGGKIEYRGTKSKGKGKPKSRNLAQ